MSEQQKEKRKPKQERRSITGPRTIHDSSPIKDRTKRFRVPPGPRKPAFSPMAPRLGFYTLGHDVIVRDERPRWVAPSGVPLEALVNAPGAIERIW